MCTREARDCWLALRRRGAVKIISGLLTSAHPPEDTTTATPPYKVPAGCQQLLEYIYPRVPMVNGSAHSQYLLTSTTLIIPQSRPGIPSTNRCLLLAALFRGGITSSWSCRPLSRCRCSSLSHRQNTREKQPLPRPANHSPLTPPYRDPLCCSV